MASLSTSAINAPHAPIVAFDLFHLRMPQNVVAAVASTQGPPDPIRLRDRVRAAVARHPELRRSMPEPAGRSWPLVAEDWANDWVAPRLDGSPESAAGRHGLARALCDFYAAPFPDAEPIWRVGLVAGAQADIPHGVMFSMHHGAADGTRALELVAAVLDGESERGGSGGPLAAPRSPSGRFESGARSPMLGPFLRRALGDMTGRRLGYLTGEGSCERRLHVGRLSRADVRRLARRAGCSVSDVLLGQVAGVLHPPAARESGGKRNARVLVPRLARTRVDGSNRYLPFVSRVAPPGDLSGFREIARAQARAGRSTAGEVQAHMLLMKMLAGLPGPLLQTLYRDWARRLDALCTILPVPLGEASMAGAAVRHLYGFAPLLWSHGASFCFLVHRETITLGVVTDPAIVSDGDALIDAVLALPAV